jgi:ABC-type multidrug transport system ATPase subunit
MDEAMRCDNIALIQNGNILSINTPAKVKEGFSRKLFRVKANEKYKLITTLRKYPQTLSAYPFGDSVHVTFTDDQIDKSLYLFLSEAGLKEVTVEKTMAGIEDRFLELMEKGVTALWRKGTKAQGAKEE